MLKKKSAKRSSMIFQHEVPVEIKNIRDHLTPFQNELSSDQSWFHDLIEWYSKVLFQNLEQTSELVESVRREFWMFGNGQERNEESYSAFAKEALDLFQQLEKEHARLDQSREIFELIRPISHRLSDRIEDINSNLKSLVKRLKG